MTKQFITQDGKPAFVVIPIAEWRRIEKSLEDRADAAAARAFLESPGETFPDGVVAAILGGAHPIKAYREHRGMTQARLAKAIGSNPVYISQIERGERQAGKKLTARLGAVLGVDPEMLTPTKGRSRENGRASTAARAASHRSR